MMTPDEEAMFEEYLDSDASDLGIAGADRMNPALEYSAELQAEVEADDARCGL